MIIKESQDSWPLKMEPTGCPETSVWNYHYMLRNIAEKCKSLVYITLHVIQWFDIKNKGYLAMTMMVTVCWIQEKMAMGCFSLISGLNQISRNWATPGLILCSYITTQLTCFATILRSSSCHLSPHMMTSTSYPTPLYILPHLVSPPSTYFHQT
jgi:hypothetical protein